MLIRLKQLDAGTGATQINSSTLLQGPSLEPNITGSTITDALNYLYELAIQDGVAALTKSDKGQSGSTTGNSVVTGLSISNSPTQDSRIDFRVNGVTYNVGENTTDDIYFTTDGGSSAIPFNSIVGGTEDLFWKGSTIGYDIDSGDELDLDYQVDTISYISGTSRAIEIETYTFTGDGATTSFALSHSYGNNLPKTFESTENDAGTIEIFEFEEVVLTNNTITINFTIAPDNGNIYVVKVGF